MKPLERILEGEHAGKIVFDGYPQDLHSIIRDAYWQFGEQGWYAVACRIQEVVDAVDWTKKVTYTLKLPKDMTDPSATFDCPLCGVEHLHGWKTEKKNHPSSRCSHHNGKRPKKIPTSIWMKWQAEWPTWSMDGQPDWNSPRSITWTFATPKKLEPEYDVVSR